MKKYIIAASFLLSSLTSFGAAYQLNLEGLRQVAMGGTGTAWPWDASTIFYNPGGLARLKNIQIYGSVLTIMPSTGFSNTTIRANTLQQSFTPVNFYIGGTVREGSRWALGLGLYTPFGSGLQWDANWAGRFMVQSSQLTCYFLQPTVSYRVGQFLSVGAGFIYANGTLDINQALPVQDLLGNDGQAKLHGNAVGIGFNTGIHLRFGDGLQMGFTYRSQVNMSIDGGTANFYVPKSLSTAFPNTTFGTQLPLPQVASFGIGLRPCYFLTLQFDLNYTGWNAFDYMRISYNTTTPYLQNIQSPRNYHNTLTPRFGLCAKISPVVSIMGGIAYDPTPVSDGYVSPDLPDADRVILSCGAAIKPLQGFTILAALESVNSVKRASSFNYGLFAGTYQSTAITPGVAIYYNF